MKRIILCAVMVVGSLGGNAEAARRMGMGPVKQPVTTRASVRLPSMPKLRTVKVTRFSTGFQGSRAQELVDDGNELVAAARKQMALARAVIIPPSGTATSREWARAVVQKFARFGVATRDTDRAARLFVRAGKLELRAGRKKDAVELFRTASMYLDSAATAYSDSYSMPDAAVEARVAAAEADRLARTDLSSPKSPTLGRK